MFCLPAQSVARAFQTVPGGTHPALTRTGGPILRVTGCGGESAVAGGGGAVAIRGGAVPFGVGVRRRLAVGTGPVENVAVDFPDGFRRNAGGGDNPHRGARGARQRPAAGLVVSEGVDV